VSVDACTSRSSRELSPERVEGIQGHHPGRSQWSVQLFEFGFFRKKNENFKFRVDF